MKLSTKAKRFAALGILLVAAIVILIWRQLAEPPPPAVSVPPSVQLLETRLVGRGDGERQWEILTHSVLQEGDLVTLTDLNEMILFQGDEPYLTVHASGATWERKLDRLELFGPVVVEGEDGFRLESEALSWDGKAQTLTSPGPVWIIWNGMEMEGQTMTLEPPSGLLHLKGDVQIREGSLLWRLDQVVYDLDGDSMDLFGNMFLEGELDDE